MLRDLAQHDLQAIEFFLRRLRLSIRGFGFVILRCLVSRHVAFHWQRSKSLWTTERRLAWTCDHNASRRGNQCDALDHPPRLAHAGRWAQSRKRLGPSCFGRRHRVPRLHLFHAPGRLGTRYLPLCTLANNREANSMYSSSTRMNPEKSSQAAAFNASWLSISICSRLGLACVAARRLSDPPTGHVRRPIRVNSRERRSSHKVNERSASAPDEQLGIRWELDSVYPRSRTNPPCWKPCSRSPTAYSP